MDLISTYYVHRSAENYMKFGIYQPGHAVMSNEATNYFQNYINEHNRILMEAETMERRVIVEQMENDYRELLYGKGETVEGFREKAAMALNEMLQEKLINQTKQVCGSVTADNLMKVNITDVKPTQIEQELLKEFSNSIKKIDGQTKIQLSNLDKIFAELRARLDYLSKNNSGTLTELQQKLNDTQITFKTLKQKLTRYQKTIYKNLGKRASKSGAIVMLQRQDVKGVDLVFLTQLIELLDIPIAAASANQQGDVGEWIAPMVNLMTTLTASENTKEIEQISVDMLKEMVIAANQGGGGIYITVDEKGQTRSSETRPIKVNIDGSFVGLETQWHRNKVDAQFYYKDKQPIEKASIKNYRSFNGLTLVDNTPLYNMLLYADDSARFSAHFLNTMVNHSDNDGYFEGYRRSAQDALRMEMLNLALMGYDKQNQPTTFIVFNNTKKDVKVFDTTLLLMDLINGAYSSQFNLTHMMQNEDGVTSQLETDMSGINITQDLNAETAEIRMQQMIDNLRTQKLHIAISVGSRMLL